MHECTLKKSLRHKHCSASIHQHTPFHRFHKDHSVGVIRPQVHSQYTQDITFTVVLPGLLARKSAARFVKGAGEGEHIPYSSSFRSIEILKGNKIYLNCALYVVMGEPLRSSPPEGSWNPLQGM